MTNGEKLGLGVLILIVGLGIGYTFRGSTSLLPSSGGHMMPDGSMMGQNIDQHFIAQMIPHHEGAVAMAKVALEKSKRPEMIALAKAIIKAQQKEIDDMLQWHTAWYGSTPSSDGMGVMHMGGMEGDLAVLQSTSAENFDREFILQMIPHHEMAIMMAGMLKASTDRAEMKQLAENVITSQSQEIELMRGWLKSWYKQ